MFISYFKKLAVFVLVLAAVAGFAIGTKQVAQAAGEPVGDVQSYVIKLRANNPSVLSPYAQRITPQFEFSSSPLFKNIFTLESTLSLDSL